MNFFNKKEEVMEILLTSYGKELLSKGQFKPVFYAFFDEGILYDGIRGSITETQNDIQNRIKNETIYSKDIADFLSSREITHMRELVPNNIDTREIPLFDFNSSFEHQLGASKNNSDKAPGWNITALQSQITSSNTVLTSSARSRVLPIPQINIDKDSISYNVSIVNTDLLTDVDKCEIDNFLDGEAVEFGDGTSLEVREGTILLKVEEKNSLKLNDSFNFELFEVIEVTGSIKTADDRQVLRTLKFFNFEESVKNGILVSDSVTSADIENLNKIDDTFVANYLEILVDEEADQEAICKLDRAKKDSKNTIFVKNPVNCEDLPEPERTDVYGAVDDGDIETFKGIFEGECD